MYALLPGEFLDMKLIGRGVCNDVIYVDNLVVKKINFLRLDYAKGNRGDVA